MTRYQLRSRAPKPGEELEESVEVVRDKARQLANMLRSSKYAVVYTGAGLSTAAGIPDFRGPSGVWTLRAKGKQLEEPDFSKVQPTFSHIVLKRLLDAGQIRHVVSQNIDGLHMRSGVPTENLSEIHGNYCLETCPKCKTAYFRPYAVWTGLATTTQPGVSFSDLDEPCETQRYRKHRRGDGVARHVDVISEESVDEVAPPANHQTGRICEKEGCNGNLRDSVILFGEDLPKQALNSAVKHSQKADLGLVLGSSLRVKPACDFPAKILGNGGRVVIVNLQKTPLDSRASLVIHATCDQVMQMLVEELSPRSRPTEITRSVVETSSVNGRLKSEKVQMRLNWKKPGPTDDTKTTDKEELVGGKIIMQPRRVPAG
ncbi:hypothetical protein R1sor_006285 [Riccia sorocarpa]|uniref:protein acetyllysine N-acetyltransferase n=1 Tax=Riccia sorocarpa TaxID=122646 RepID=A0ABD3HQA2_9MARC